MRTILIKAIEAWAPGAQVNLSSYKDYNTVVFVYFTLTDGDYTSCWTAQVRVEGETCFLSDPDLLREEADL